jgi:hypothetical protein
VTASHATAIAKGDGSSRQIRILLIRRQLHWRQIDGLRALPILSTVNFDPGVETVGDTDDADFGFSATSPVETAARRTPD